MSRAMPTVQAIRHVHFEDLGSFAAPLTKAGYAIRYDEAAAHGHRLAVQADAMLRRWLSDLAPPAG